MHIIGIWNPQKTLVNANIFDQFGKLYLAYDNHVEKLDNNQATVFYEGTIFNYTSDEILNNKTALEEAFGLYTYIKIIKNSQEIIIGTDKLGFSPLYYSQQNDSLYFSTSLTLLKYYLEKVTPNYEAWDEILNLSTILGDKTTIKEICRMTPGTRIHINRKKISFHKYWSLEIPEKCEKKNFIEQNNELLIEALEYTRKVNLQKIVLLSGGEDSRRIALTTHKIALPVILATQEADIKNGVDKNVLIAQEVSKNLKIPFIRIKLPCKETYFNNSLIRDYWLAYETHYHDWIVPLLKEIPVNSLIYDGIIGDVTINGHWARIYPDRYRIKDIDKIAKSITEENVTFKFDTAKLESPLFERVRDQLQGIPDCPSRVDYFYIMNRARRNISQAAQLYSLMGHKTCYPFLYYPLFMQSLSLDPLEKLNMFFQRECIRAIDPKIAEIPTTRDNLSNKYLIDRKMQKKEIEHFFYKQLKIRSEMIDLFPQQSMKIKAIKFSSMMGMNTILNRLNWYVNPLNRISNFLDWIDVTDCPDFPIKTNQPDFLRNRFLSKL